MRRTRPNPTREREETLRPVLRKPALHSPGAAALNPVQRGTPPA
ncbi:hypothetical protein [Deinococcus sp. RIT780]|nr:hypothetical protein [Deinococcus sp. RIT780]